MKILFISDIHGITTNLMYIKELIKKEIFDKIVVLGDLYYCGQNYGDYNDVDINYVKNFLTSYKNKLICIKGNCDSDVDVMVSDFPILEDMAYMNVDGLDLYLTHGNKFNIDNNKLDKGIFIYGHKHYPFIIKKDNVLYLNPGSISLPRNESKPSYMIYDNGVFTIYNVDDEVVDKCGINE